MNLFEARYAGSSVYIDWVRRTIQELEQRVSAVTIENERVGFSDWRQACEFVRQKFDPQDTVSCEDLFMLSENLGIKESQQAVEDLTKEFGEASVSHDFHEEINTWGLPNDITVQVFTTRDEMLDLDPFMLVFHDFGIDPERILQY